MRRHFAGISVLSVLAATALAVPSMASAAPAPAATGKHPVAVGTGGAMASMDTDASRAGITVLKHGGNAIDAAVAVASTLGVTIPFVAGPGGGGFMVIYLARTHQVVTIDGREACPQACTPTHVHRQQDRPAARLRLRLGPAAGDRGAVDGGHLGRGGPPLRPGEPGRGPAAGHRGRRARIPGQLRLPPADRVRAAAAAGLPGQPQAAADQVRQPAAGRHPAAQPRPGEDLPAAGPPRPVLPLRRAHRPGHRPRRRPSGADARPEAGPAARDHEDERPAQLRAAGRRRPPMSATAGSTSTAWRRRPAAGPRWARH